MGEGWIRVNVVSPGTIDTLLLRANMTPAIKAERAAKIPRVRLGIPEEIADTVLFLVSPAGSPEACRGHVLEDANRSTFGFSAFTPDRQCVPWRGDRPDAGMG